MKKYKQRVIFSLLIFSIFYGLTMAADSPCGDWEPYKDEKCFKVFDNIVIEEEAKKTCSQQETSATLVTIHSKDEQDFLSNLLFKTHKVVDAVWIGAKYSINKFKWSDDSDLSFTNWAEGSPSNSSDKACLQMIPESSSMGKWVDEPCNKSNKFVCQKMQNWSISRLQKTLLDARKLFEDVTKQLNSSLDDAKKEINNLKQHPVPIGFIYVQLPGQPEPKTLWSTVEWKDVTSDYAGLFFRAEGGGSLAFGQIQDENSPRLTSINGLQRQFDIGLPGQLNIQPGVLSQSIYTGGQDPAGNEVSLKFLVSPGEVRPRNQAIRIWKRTN